MKNRYIKQIIYLVICLIIGACKKSTFLDAKPSQSLVVPTTLADFQGILDNDGTMNGFSHSGAVPGLGEAGADNCYVLADDYSAYFNSVDKNTYIWAKDIFSGEESKDWNMPYRIVFYANEVLDGIKNIAVNTSNGQSYNNVKGSALFYRAHMFYQLAQVFAPPYNKNSANKDLGIPLRLTSDLTEKMYRASIAQTYNQIIADLLTAKDLLPNTPIYPTRPSKAAAYGLLARLYQTIQDYDKSYAYADSCLKLQSSIMDFNTISSVPFPKFNKEIIFSSEMIEHNTQWLGYIDSALYKSYDSNDLRLSLYYQTYMDLPYFAGGYDGTNYAFAGIATDEIYLIKAECEARNEGPGSVDAAMKDLNTLLKNRWKTGTFIPLTATNATDALTKILIERKKELLYRGLRWTDLRRLNTDPRFAVTLTRNILGKTYTLPSNDPRYVYPIPNTVLSFNPSMQQNQR